MPSREIIGPNITEDIVASADAYLDSRAAKGREKLPGELEKTDTQLWYLQRINEMIAEYCRDIGVEPPEPLNPDQFHFLDDEAFMNFLPTGKNVSGLHREMDESAYFNVATVPGGRFYVSVLHEALHLAAFQRYYADANQGKLIAGRSGYTAKSLPKSDRRRLIGLDEAMVDTLVQKILERHRQELAMTLDVEPKEFRKEEGLYRQYQDILELIVERVAASSGQPTEEYQRTMEREYFSGSLMHLRQIGKVYGPDALEILGQLGSAQVAALDKGEGIQTAGLETYQAYFAETDPERRRQLAHTILYPEA